MSSEAATARPSVVKSFVRQYRNAILAEWRLVARELPIARELSSNSLVDHIPDLLDEVADIADDVAADGDVRCTVQTARYHALDRLAKGFDVTLVVTELSMLRGAAMAVWSREIVDGKIAELRALNLAIDRAMAISVGQFEQRLGEAVTGKDRALAKLESLLAASTAGIAFLDRDLRYLRVNAALAEMNGRPVEDHIGHTVAEVLPGPAPQLEPVLRSVLETGSPIRNLEVTSPVPDAAGTVRTFLLNYFPVRGPSGVVAGVGGHVVDVTEFKRVHEAVRSEQQRTQSIIDHCPAAIWVKDADGRIVLANRRLADVLGVPYEGMIGRRTNEILPPDIARQHEEHDQIVLIEQRAIEVEETVPSATDVRTFLSIKFPIPGTPRLVGGIATDITDRKRIEEELRLAVRSREDILAIVSHDLRTPLGTIQLSATMMLGQLGADPRWRRHLEMIQRASQRMETLIDDLLDTANIRARRLQLEVRPEAADDVVREALDIHRPIVEERGIALTRRCDIASVEIQCDRNRVLQVFGNLIGNAVKFCRPGDTITVTCARAGGEMQVSIADTGPGIPPDVASKIFEPYWSATPHAKLGAGLGLYIAKGIIEGHGGRLWADSTPGHGATFSFTLPIAG
jgi:PAS domain S-box-containing protein